MVSLSEHAPPAVTGPRPDPVVPERTSNATRHLSAGAYIDNEFCLTALREVYYQPRRIVAPAYGFDAVTVLGHCLRARRSMVLRDAVLVCLLLLALWSSLAGALVFLAGLLVFHLACTTVVVGRESIVYLRESMRHNNNPATDGRGRARVSFDRYRNASLTSRGFRRLWLENVFAALVARVFGIVATYVAFACLALAAAFWLRRGDLMGGPVPPAVTAYLVGPAFLVPAVLRIWDRLQVRALLPGRRVGRPVATPRLEQIERQMGGNTVVYSGHRPFVGSGEVLRRWDLAQRLVMADPSPLDGASPLTSRERLREFPTPPFKAQQISDYVREHLRRIAHDEQPERNLPNLTVSDQIFVAGTEISDLRTQTPHEQVGEIIRNPTAPQRHYLSCQVVSWRGELVTTVYVHFAVQGKALYVELYVTGLLPCDGRFRIVDEVGGTGVKAVLHDAARAMVSAPALVASAPANLLRAIVDQLSLVPARKLGRLRRGYDYGARAGLRELGASGIVRDHMQTQDIIKYGRVIERRVLAAILDFLEEHGVDITEYRQRSMTILNAGAVATAGGTVNVQGDAVGLQDNAQKGDR
jgi:hypothetical protein